MEKSQLPRWARHSVRYTEKQMLPYVTAIGQLTLAWNDLHEKLGMLFCIVMGGGCVARFAGLWNAAAFDRPKRKLLEAAITTMTQADIAPYPRLQDDVRWMLKHAEALEENRNNAVHSPLLLIRTGQDVPTHSLVIPDNLFGNYRAKKLQEKNLLAEFRWCRDSTLALRDFAALIDFKIGMDVRDQGASIPWPERPKLPNRGQKKSRRSEPRQSPIKSRTPQPRSS